MDRRVFIHVGLPKTGTTSLQYYFLEQLDGPAAPIRYVPVGLSGSGEGRFAHHNLAREMIPDGQMHGRFNPARGSLDDVTRWIATHNPPTPLMLSTEGFWAVVNRVRPRRQFAGFVERLRADRPVEILVTWRNYVDYALSGWFNSAKFAPPGRPAPVPDIDRLHGAFMDRMQALRAMADTVTVFRYGPDILGRYLDHLGSVAGQPLPSAQDARRRNPSLNAAQRAYALSVARMEQPPARADYRTALAQLADAALPSEPEDFGFDVASLRALAARRGTELLPTGNMVVVG